VYDPRGIVADEMRDLDALSDEMRQVLVAMHPGARTPDMRNVVSVAQTIYRTATRAVRVCESEVFAAAEALKARDATVARLEAEAARERTEMTADLDEAAAALTDARRERTAMVAELAGLRDRLEEEKIATRVAEAAR
jgi:hypothetical protein